MNEDLVSVIITTYKRDITILKRAISSVLEQTYKNIEIIIVNDYPPYELGIKELINKYDNIRCIFHKNNEGACKSRNDGINISKGKFIAFLDDDDEWFPKKIERQVSIIKKSNVDIVYCSGKYIYSDRTSEKSPFIYYPEKNLLQELLKKNFMGGCSFPLMKKDKLLSVGCFDENFPSSQDYDLWIRFAINYNVGYIDEELVKYYVMDQSISSNIDKRIVGYKMLLKKYRKYYSKYPKSKADFYKVITENAFHNKKFITTLITILESFSVFPHNYNVIFIPLSVSVKYILNRLNKKKS